MRLVPPLQTILSFSHKAKYSTLVAWQAAISTRICSGSTWELSANLVLDRPDPSSGQTLRSLLMAIPSHDFPSTPLFHTKDCKWCSTNGITFTFHPENEADARSHIAGLIPFLKETANPWYLKLFSEESKLQHATSRWDTKTRQAFSAEEAEIDNFLDDDDELNLTEEQNIGVRRAKVEVNIPQVAELEKFPEIYKDNV